MATTDRITVGVAFGGVSPEHEVSVISAHQVLAAMDTDRFAPVPLYVGKDGRWFIGDVLHDLEAYADLNSLREKATAVTVGSGSHGRLVLVPQSAGGLFSRRPEPVEVDVVFIAFHGGSGEDGGMQGLCESMGVPYTGSGVLASSLGMDKVVSKQLCREAGIPVVDYVAVVEWEWAGSEEVWLETIEKRIGFPVIVKPARLGSSIGIALARDRKSLDRKIEEAFRFDSKIVVERAVSRLREINCSVLGSAREARLSVLEQPIPAAESGLLSYADKYQRSDRTAPKSTGTKSSRGEGMASLDRIIPAPIDSETEKEIRALAQRVFRLFDCSGVVRIDFMIDESDGAIYFNEINTIPGSFSFYLWDPAGVDFTSLVTQMIELGLERHRSDSARVRSYDVNLLSARSLAGLKGSKS